MTDSKKFNVYNQRLRSSYSPTGRGKTQLRSVAEQHKKDIWTGRGYEQFGVVKSAEKTDVINPLTMDRPKPGQFYYAVRVYSPTINGYFSQPKDNQSQLIEALCPEFIGPSNQSEPIPGQQARIGFKDPSNISMMRNNGEFKGIVGDGLAPGAGSKIVPCSLTPVVIPPNGGSIPGKTPPNKTPAKKPGSSGGSGPKSQVSTGSPTPTAAATGSNSTEIETGFISCDTNYAVGDFIKAYQVNANGAKNIASKKKVKPRFPTAPAYRISSPFGERIHPVKKVKKFHKGIDIACPNKTPILSIFPGTVISTNKTDATQAGGLWVKIRHDSFGGIISFYCHLNNVLVSKGDKVDYGTQIGLGGNTGLSTGPHLHFEIRKPSRGSGSQSKVTHLDPEEFLKMDFMVDKVEWDDLIKKIKV